MNQKKIWINGKFVNWDQANIHILTHALHYGTGVFEGIRCYNTYNGPAIFRLLDHLHRFINSSKIYHMNLKFSIEELKLAIIDTIKVNKVYECYIRPIAFYGYGKMGVNPLPNAVSISIALWKWDEYLENKSTKEGIRVIISSWNKMDSRCLPTLAKATANYANSALARMEAIKLGVDEAIMLNIEGKVAEGTAENVFIVRDSIAITPPTTAGALEGITRATVLKIADELGIKSKICNISRDEMYLAEEIFLTGTAAEIKPIIEIDKRIVSDGKKGRITGELQKQYQNVVHGRNKKFNSWLTYII